MPQAWRSWDLALVCCGTALLAAALWRVPFQVEWHWSLGILTAIVFLVAIIVWVWAEKSPEPPDGRYEAYRKRLPSLARFYSKLLMQLPGKLGFVIAPVALFDPGGAVPLNQRLALATLAGVLAALWARWVERSFPLWRASMNSFVGYFGIVALLPRLGLWNVLVFLVGLRVTMLFAVKYFEREA